MRTILLCAALLIACDRREPVNAAVPDAHGPSPRPREECDNVGDHVFHVLMTSAHEEAKADMVRHRAELVESAVARCRELPAAARECVLKAQDPGALDACFAR